VSFPRYPAYKDSGAEWLGAVPRHWTVQRADAVVDTVRDTVEAEALSGFVVFHYSIPVVQATGDGQEEDGSDIDSSKLVVASPQVLVSKLNPRKGTVCVAMPRGLLTVASSEFVPLVPRNAELHYVAWVAQCESYRQRLEALVQSATKSHQRVLPSDIVKFQWAFPPLAEQSAIAAFLDRETAKIDALVAEQRRLMELLKEKRQAAIAHAVTKGLNPDAPMKDSGVEWLGEVPAHWTIGRIKRVMSSIEQGWSPQCESFAVESPGEWGVLKVGCVNGGIFTPEENKVLPVELEPIPALALSAGDLLVSRANTRELVGSAAVALTDYPNLMLCDKIYRLRFLPEEADPRFVAFYLGCAAARGQIELDATGASASMVNIAQSALTELLMPTPPLAEQRAIIASVDRELELLRAMSTEARHSVDLLIERRSALISAAVTGQIDVRGLATQEAA
jgi:type I restriction enzyme S subunit